MDEREKNYFNSILKHCEIICGAVEGKESFQEFDEDIHKKQSVALSLIQIGEIINKLDKENYKETMKMFPKQEIIAVRNRIVHGYGTIDWTIIWQIAEDDIPKIEETIKQKLQEN
jgi:uncharacterized protein with HEPN domain